MPRKAAQLLVALLAVLCAATAAPAPAAAVAPTASAPPTITGQTRDGQTLTGSTGTWSGTAPITYTRRWERCDADGLNCAPISGATGATYVLVAADVGGTLRHAVIASNMDGSSTMRSAPSSVIDPKAPPVNDILPSIGGTALDGQSLTASNGTWTGTAPMSWTRKWLRCAADGTACAAISGATAANYILASADVGRTIRLEITASNADGQTIARSAPTPIVDGLPPVNTVAPPLGGTPRAGQTLSSSTPGAWDGSTPLTYTRRWERCDPEGASCVPISGATGSSYVLTDADAGSTVRIVVTATNPKSSASAPSAPSAVVGPRVPPAVSTPPAITGVARDMRTLSASDGTWTGTPAIGTSRRWQRCDSAGDTCVTLTASGPTYALTPADVGSRMRVLVTATNPDGTTTFSSDPTAVVEPAAPTSTVLPTVTGSAREGQVLTAAKGTWTGTPTITYAYQWHRCSGSTCTTIDGATEATYRLAPADTGSTLRVAVTASNDGGDTAAWSAHTATVAPGPPVNLELPTATGPLPRDGQLYTGTVGTWAGTAPIVHDRQWQRCTSAGSSCVAISGEVAATYRLQSADVGKTIRLEITAANAQGTVKIQSVASPVIAASPPLFETPPVAGGEARDGQLLTASPGTLRGTAPIALTHTWQRCDVLSGTCADIAGATASTYRLTGADVGARVRVRVGATNASGGAVAFSAETAIVVKDPPRSATAPAVTGTAREGERLTSTNGTFTGTAAITYAVRWQRCDAAGANCVDTGATGSQYVLGAADVGATVRSAVTATNDAGSDTARSAATAVVAAAPPRNAVPPAVSATELRDGRTLTASEGAWDGSRPMTFAYQWQRCRPAGDQCADVVGATAASYVLQTGDVGSAMRVVVTAANAAGSAAQPSSVTGTVGTNPPVVVSPPSVVGDAEDGTLLRAEPGEWSGLVPFTTTYRWWRCDALGENCGEIPGATASTYRLVPGDVGLTVRAQVMQTNAGGSTAATTDQTAVVRAAPPTVVVDPQVTGAAAVGRTLGAEAGVWAGTPELDFVYQWQRCAADGTGCADVPGATSASYALTAADDAAVLRVVVTATNDIGSASAISATTAEVQDDPPVNVAQPSIEATGLIAEGATLTGRAGAWGGAQPIDLTHQWRRCDANGAACVDIAGATTQTYKLVREDVGRRIILFIGATNIVASSSAQSTATPVVLPEPPANTLAPVVTATSPRDGGKLTATTGTWTGATPMTYTTTWLRCDTDGGACSQVPDALGPAYTLTPADVGHRIRARVSARNAADERSHDSSPTAVITGAAPESSARPAVVVLDGRAQVGARMRASLGTWGGTAPVRLSVRWQRCAGSTLAACEDIPGATNPDYVLSEDDVGRRLRVVVSAANMAGQQTAESTPSSAVPATSPESDAPPAVTGVAREGQELSSTSGTWRGSRPLALAYQWERCPNPGATSCPKVNGATRATYALTTADVGKFMRMTVTATNAGGKATRASLTTEQVAGLAPRNEEVPTVMAKGTLRAGGSLVAAPGRWTGTAPMTFAYQWQKCNSRGQACADVPGAEKATFTLKLEDLDGSALDKPMRVVVIATNLAGQARAFSTALGAIAETAPPAKNKRRAKKVNTPLARYARLRFTPKGVLAATLTCPRNAKRSCAARTTVTLGKAFSHAFRVKTLKRGKRVTRTVRLTPAQRRAFRRRRTALLRFTVATISGTPRRSSREVRIAVPRALSGAVAKKKKAAKRRPAKRLTAKQRAARRRAAARKRAAAKKRAAATPATPGATPAS